MDLANFKFEIVTDSSRLSVLTADAPADVIADVEHLPERLCCKGPHYQHLLGVAITWRGAPVPFFVQFHEWNAVTGQLELIAKPGLREALAQFLKPKKLWNWHIEHDRPWLNNSFELETVWGPDVRVMWYLSDKEQQRSRGYGLKKAQVQLLDWGRTNESELEGAVKAAGGNLDDGDHYLAPSYLLGRYACLDVVAVDQAKEKLSPFFDKHDYWWYAQQISDYGTFVQSTTDYGVAADQDQLAKARDKFERLREEATADIRKVCAKEIQDIEADWFIQDAKAYGARPQSQKARYKFLVGLPGAKKRRTFNPKSNDQRNLLFHGKLGFPVLETTDGGKPKSDRTTISMIKHPAAEVFVRVSENEKLRSMAASYERNVKNGRIHFPYDWCATVHTRLGGFEPYALNMPFDCEDIMRAFFLDENEDGTHGDLKSIEPCWMAALSGDETLLKVHRDGLGDVYLDIALRVFPLVTGLHSLYDPWVVCQEETKEALKKYRKPSKIIKLAYDYGGTEATFATNLTKAGFPTTKEEAVRLRNILDDLFWKVRELEGKLKALHARDGFLRTPWGGVIQIPKQFEKDTLNRMISRTAHETHMEWVREINLLRKTQGVTMRAVLPDLHDATSWAGPKGQHEVRRQVFEEALRNVNARVGLPVTIQAEVKPFTTFYGLKNRE